MDMSEYAVGLPPERPITRTGRRIEPDYERTMGIEVTRCFPSLPDFMPGRDLGYAMRAKRERTIEELKRSIKEGSTPFGRIIRLYSAEDNSNILGTLKIRPRGFDGRELDDHDIYLVFVAID